MRTLPLGLSLLTDLRSVDRARSSPLRGRSRRATWDALNKGTPCGPGSHCRRCFDCIRLSPTNRTCDAHHYTRDAANHAMEHAYVTSRCSKSSLPHTDNGD